MCDSDSYAQDNTGVDNKVKYFEDNILFNPKNKGKVVYMLFKANWCGACNAFKPEFLKYREVCKTSKKDDMIMVIIDVDTASDLTKEYGVESMPTTYVYKIDDKLLKNRHKKLEMYDEKIVGNDKEKLDSVMKKYSNISL